MNHILFIIDIWRIDMKNNVVINEYTIYELDDECLRTKEKNNRSLKENINTEKTRKQDIEKNKKNWL